MCSNAQLSLLVVSEIIYFVKLYLRPQYSNLAVISPHSGVIPETISYVVERAVCELHYIGVAHGGSVGGIAPNVLFSLVVVVDCHAHLAGTARILVDART